MRVQSLMFGFALAATAVTFAACGGGGGGSSTGGGGSVVPATPTPTPTPVPNVISGTAIDFTSGAALAGFTVTVGTLPTAAMCNAAQTATIMPCGFPVAPVPTVTTSATGAFSVTVATTGTYMLTIAKDSTYATLHRSVTASAGTTTLGSLKITALSADEQAWLTNVNNQRATVSIPVSFGNLVVDEFAEEQARQWAADELAGRIQFSDASYSAYQTAYGANSGALYSAAGVLALNLLGQMSAYVSVDSGWMAERANCPNANWQTCAASETTGHYINMSNTNTVWVGLGEAANTSVNPYSFYDLMLIENLGGPSPASKARAI